MVMEESLVCQWSVFRSLLAILQWWAFNVTVIIMNKWIFQKLEFKFPLSVSCIHFICSAIGGYVVIKVLKLKPLITVDPEDRWRRIFPMSFVFCINIVLGNVSLRYIPVSFMQTIKSFTPATTVVLQWLVWRKYFDWRIWASLIPIVGGILLTSVTELSFNMFGFCAALFGCLATSTKTILAESLLHGYKFDRLQWRCKSWMREGKRSCRTKPPTSTSHSSFKNLGHSQLSYELVGDASALFFSPSLLYPKWTDIWNILS